MPAPAFINEIHYDNAGADSGEFIEIAGVAGTDLTGWKIVLYNGANGASYNPVMTLSGVIANQQNGFGTISVAYPTDGIQNGSPDAIALVDASNNVIQFLSYEGSFTATNGPAAGLTSVNVGVSENGTQSGTSIGLIGSGTTYEDFHWALINGSTAGGVNAGQSFGGVVPPQPGTLNIADATTVEGNSGDARHRLHRDARRRQRRRGLRHLDRRFRQRRCRGFRRGLHRHRHRQLRRRRHHRRDPPAGAGRHRVRR